MGIGVVSGPADHSRGYDLRGSVSFLMALGGLEEMDHDKTQKNG
jgi:hypothetical protein